MSQDTLLEVLLWLDRFDLDGQQITTKNFCSLAVLDAMPLRKVDLVAYESVERVLYRPGTPGFPGKRNTLSIRLEENSTAIVELHIGKIALVLC